jgi:hypothetical protein
MRIRSKNEKHKTMKNDKESQLERLSVSSYGFGLGLVFVLGLLDMSIFGPNFLIFRLNL